MASTESSKPKDTEARYQWYQHGRDLEDLFLEEVAPELGIDIWINPRKDEDPTVIDMIYKGYPADLKTQNTPFFTSSKYGIPAQYAVTFNHKDYVRYKKLYPYAIIFFWIHWTTLSWNNFKVKPMNKVVRIPFWKIVRDIENGTMPLHTYQKRQVDKRANAKDSYIIDIRKYTEIGDLS